MQHCQIFKKTVQVIHALEPFIYIRLENLGMMIGKVMDVFESAPAVTITPTRDARRRVQIPRP